MKSEKGKILIAIVLTFVITAAVSLGAVGFVLRRGTSIGFDSSLLSEEKAYLDYYYYENIDKNELDYAAAKGMTDAADDYTNYYTPEEYNKYIESNTGVYVGVGLVVSKTDANDIIVVLPYEGASGYEAGIKAGDIIKKVDGVAYNGDKLEEVASAMRGHGAEDENTNVTVTISRDGSEAFDVVLTRKQVHLKTVSSKMLEGDIGYARIIAFDEDTDAEFEANYNELVANGAKNLIIDLRDNGGGDFNTACRLAGKFLEDKSVIVYTEDKYGKRSYEYASGKITDIPVVVLVNGNSASASEVLLGSLKCNGRVREIVGTKTYGKGIMQAVLPLKNGGGMSITVARYFTGDGVCIHGIGIEPTIAVESGFASDYPSTLYTDEKDAQLKRAIEVFKQ